MADPVFWQVQPHPELLDDQAVVTYTSFNSLAPDAYDTMHDFLPLADALTALLARPPPVAELAWSGRRRQAVQNRAVDHTVAQALHSLHRAGVAHSVDLRQPHLEAAVSWTLSLSTYAADPCWAGPDLLDREYGLQLLASSLSAAYHLAIAHHLTLRHANHAPVAALLSTMRAHSPAQFWANPTATEDPPPYHERTYHTPHHLLWLRPGSAADQHVRRLLRRPPPPI